MLLCSRIHSYVWLFKQEVLRRTNRLLSCDTTLTGTIAANSYSIVACVFATAVTFFTYPLPSTVRRDTHRDRMMEGIMNYAVGMGSGTMI
jgi:hypothetical protein